MPTFLVPTVDVVVITRGLEPLHHEVEGGLRNQVGIQIVLHRVVGRVLPKDSCRFETIARARNEGKQRGNAPWLMFVDDDVVLEPQCVSTLVKELSRRPVFAALAADYIGERREGQIAPHVSMGATLFRRQQLEQTRFTWRNQKCECQCCCEDLRRLHWGIDYCSAAKARHLPKDEFSGNRFAAHSGYVAPTHAGVNEHELSVTAHTPKVCLVACFFGTPPGWINQYLLSCAFNPTIDFLIITDQQDFPPTPPNVLVKRLDKSSFNTLATMKTGVEINLSHPRKLCDFKPAYGHLFEELLEGWDYWGYTDLDVIYGDIRRFLSAARIQEFDVYTARKEFLVGHFTLFRNNHSMRMLYQQSSDFRTTMQSPEVQSFDECGKQWMRRLRGEPLNGDATCDSMTHVVHRMMGNNRLSACFSSASIEWPEVGDADWRLKWRAGRLWVVNQQREAMYFHFHAFKGNLGYREPMGSVLSMSFDMSQAGFEPAHAHANGNESYRAAHGWALRALSVNGTAKTPPPLVLTAFNQGHLRLFSSSFLASLRATGNKEKVIPVAIGLLPRDREQLGRVAGVAPIFHGDTGVHVARRRLRDFAEITRALPPETPIAYWDAGDVIFQSRLQPLWDLVRAHPGKLLAAREPSEYPENPVVAMWTESITDPSARIDAQRAIFNQPFLNGGFLAGSAGTLTRYFETVAHWYETPKLSGSTDPGDQLALNVYCHSQSDEWHEIPEGWNYCLWGRKTCFRRRDGQYVDVRAVPIHVVHGNAHSFTAVPVSTN